MSTRAKPTDPELWEKVKAEVTKSAKGGEPDQWSARKAQMAVQMYKKRGGGYEGQRREDNSLRQWTEEDWGTKSGRRSAETGERYLPKEAREHLSDEEYGRTTDKKRADRRKGRQFSAQPKDVAQKTAKYRHNGHGKKDGRKPSKAELYEEARRKNILGRSRMSKAELQRAVT